MIEQRRQSPTRSDRALIVFFLGSLSRGGAEKVMINVATTLQSEGHDVLLVVATELRKNLPEVRRRLPEVSHISV